MSMFLSKGMATPAPSRSNAPVTTRRWAMVSACAALALGLAHCRRADVGPPNIILVVIDTLRADRLGVYGNDRGLTPFLDQLASRGTVFANAYAPSSWTCPSVASLFTSRYASQHHVVNFDAKLAGRETTLADVLATRGYVAGGFSANFRLLKRLGYAQGFAHWRVYMAPDASAAKAGGDILRRESRAWLEQTGKGGKKQPTLLYLQYMEPHSPYKPREPYRSTFGRLENTAVDEEVANKKVTSFRTGNKGLSAPEVDLLESLYDGEVAEVDAEIRALFADLDALGFLDHAIVVITADHGEEFGEHGEFLHGMTLYNPAIRVPLILIAPGYGGGRVVSENVSLVDVAPTLLELAGAPKASSFEGRSLVPLMRGRTIMRSLRDRLKAPPPPPDVISELEYVGKGFDLRTHSQAMISGTQKVLVTRHGEAFLYDLSTDPGEARSLAESDGTRTAALISRLERVEATLKTRAGTAQRGEPMDEATREKLRALGYQP